MNKLLNDKSHNINLTTCLQDAPCCAILSGKLDLRVSTISFDPDQVRRSVGPDLGPNCLQRQ